MSLAIATDGARLLRAVHGDAPLRAVGIGGIRWHGDIHVIVGGACGYRLHGPCAVDPRYGRDGGQRRHHLGQRVWSAGCSRSDDAKYRADGIIFGGNVIISVARVEPNFAPTSDSRYRYESVPCAAPNWVTDDLLGKRNSRACRWGRNGDRRGTGVTRRVEDPVAPDEQISIRAYRESGRLAKIH